MRKLFPLILGTCLFTAPSLVLAASEAPKAAVAAPARGDAFPGAPANELASDKARYAARENEPAASEAQNYQGGDTVVIGATTATAILAVLLLIVLI